MTYALLAIPFLAAALAVAAVAQIRGRGRSGEVGTRDSVGGRGLPWRAVLLAGLALMLLTAVFDTVMIAVGLFEYADSQILGWRIGLAPIEDFAYPLAGVILLPALWALMGERDAR